MCIINWQPLMLYLKTAQLQLNCQGCPVGHVPNLFIAVIQDFTPAKRLFSGNQNTVNSNQTLTIMTFIMTQENFYQKKHCLIVLLTWLLRNGTEFMTHYAVIIHPLLDPSSCLPVWLHILMARRWAEQDTSIQLDIDGWFHFCLNEPKNTIPSHVAIPFL